MCFAKPSQGVVAQGHPFPVENPQLEHEEPDLSGSCGDRMELFIVSEEAKSRGLACFNVSFFFPPE